MDLEDFSFLAFQLLLLQDVECWMFVFPVDPFDFSMSAFQRFSLSAFDLAGCLMSRRDPNGFYALGVISALKSFFVNDRPFFLQSLLNNLLRSIRSERFNRLALGKLARVRKNPAN